ncbi:MAG: FRG domain-containing protein [Marinomonas atlantica]|nr:FRG domain-containing protein [Marinomonas atlantica]
MARKSRWEEGKLIKGVMEANLISWKYFSDYINQEMLNYTSYIYRGHGDSAWKLEPTLDRHIKSPTSPKRKVLLDTFKFETRGRRGGNPVAMDDENDWWALGQHHGLYTPLLDWTESPFVALYFAAFVAQRDKTKSMCVYALSQDSIENKNKYINENDIPLINKKKPKVKIVRPFTDENSRLVSQRGLFTRGPNNMDMEHWVSHFPQEENSIELIKIIIPTTDILNCLKYLNRMNINHSTLFPDLIGASEYCNKNLLIKNY